MKLALAQYKVVMDAAAPLDPEKREIFLWRVSARLQLSRGFSDDDVQTRCARHCWG